MSQSHRIYRFRKPSDRIKLTDANVLQATPRAKEYFIKDSEVRGLHLRVLPSGFKAFYVIRGQYKFSLGCTTVLSVKQARSLARGLLSSSDALPKAISNKRPVSSLEQLLSDYFEANIHLSDGYRSNLNQMLRVLHRYKNRPVNELDTDSLLEVFQKARGRFSDASIDTSLNGLTVLLNFAIARGELDRNPTSNIRKRGLRLQPNIRSGKLVSESDFQSFFWLLGNPPSGTGISTRNVIDHQKVRDCLLFMFLTGCRVGEALNLKVSDVYLNTDNERGATGQIRPRAFTFTDTKNGTDHALQMTPLLNALVTRNFEEDNEYVFRHKGLKFSSAYSRVERLLGKVGIRPHDLRRTFAYWASTVMREYEVSIILNHTNKRTNMTERYIGEHTDKTLSLLHAYQKKVQKFNYRDEGGMRVYGFKGLVAYGFDDEELVELVELEQSLDKSVGDYDNFYA
jgi:integrase